MFLTNTHKFATYWIAACIAIHAFAMQCEAEEGDDEDPEYNNLFIAEGLSPSSSKSDGPPLPPNANVSQTCTHAAKQKCEKLKCPLLCAKENRQ